MMLIKRLKTFEGLQQAELANVSVIMDEVKTHGFYSAYCANLLPNIANHDALIGAIEHLAARAELQVTFNAEESICIFEDY